MLERFSPKRLAKKTLALGLAGTTMLGADKILSAQTNANPGVKKEIKKGQEKEIPILDEVPPENVKIVRDIILRSYVDRANPKIQSIDSLIGLDPHTRYIALNKFEKWNNPFESKSVSRQFMLPDNVTGYIKLDLFNHSSGEELESAISNLKPLGMKQLVLDLRYNSGGYLSAAVEVAEKFLPEGKLIVYTRGRTPRSFQEFYSVGGPSWNGPLVILINYESASAAEIVAGAIQDYDEGVIAGEMSYGKGLVQSQYRFKNGDALLLTTSRWYLPSSRSIQRSYKPFEHKDKYVKRAYDLETRRAQLGSPPKYKTESGRMVHAHAGIVPDTTISAGIIPEEEIRRVADHPAKVLRLFAEKYINENPVTDTLDVFVQKFKVTRKTLVAFKDIVAGTDSLLAVKIRDKKFNGKLRRLLKREIGFAKYGAAGLWRLDDQLRNAVGVFPRARSMLTKK